MSDTDYKNSIKEINKLYSDREKRAAARKFMLSCKESGIAYPVALDLLKASAAINPDLNENTNLKPLNSDYGENKTEKAENRQNIPLTGEVLPNVETVTDAGGLNMAEIENKVRIYLDDFCSQNNIDDMTKAPQRVWSAACTFIGSKVFHHTKTLKIDGNKNNAYDISKIAACLNFFIFLCNSYNKTFTLDAAEDFLGVCSNFLCDHREKLTAAGIDPKQKAEASLASGIMDGRLSPVGMIANLNHNFNWNNPVQTATKPQNNIYIFPSLGKLSPGVVPELPQVTE